MKYYIIRSCNFLLLISVSVFSLQAQSNLGAQIQSILADSILKTAIVGVSIRNTVNNKIVFEQYGTKSFTPASNLKLVTTSAALSILGPDYRFKTKLQYSGDIHTEGDFQGNLLVVGGGDPTFGSDKMPGVQSYQSIIKNWVSLLKSKGLKNFNGVLVIDQSHFEFNPVPNDYTWGDIGNYYGAGSFGLNMNDNQYNLTLKPGRIVGDTVSVVSVIPKDTSTDYVNNIVTGAAGTGDKTILYSSPYNTFIYGQGTIPIGNPYTVKGSIANPSSLFAQLFIEEMKMQGIHWAGEIKIVKKRDTNLSNLQWNVLVEYQSPTIKEIASYTNLISNNLYAECMLKEIGFKTKGVGSTEVGASEVKKYVFRQGVDTIGLVLKDGSGMSPFNSISPNQLTLLLSKVMLSNNIMSCIPVAGKEGTVSHICKETGGNVRVKSGTMNGTACYSGYVKSNSGNVYAVSLLVNKHNTKNRSVQRVLEKVLMKVLEN